MNEAGIRALEEAEQRLREVIDRYVSDKATDDDVQEAERAYRDAKRALLDQSLAIGRFVTLRGGDDGGRGLGLRRARSGRSR